jgi:hypothetical protein
MTWFAESHTVEHFSCKLGLGGFKNNVMSVHETVSFCALMVAHNALVSISLFDEPSPTTET